MALDVTGFIRAARAGVEPSKIREDDLLDTEPSLAELLNLCAADGIYSDRLDAFVSHHPHIFLNPAAVGGDMRAPLRRQVDFVLKTATVEFNHALRTALATGALPAAADSDDEYADVAADWRADAVSTWAAALRDAARRAAGGVSLPDGRFVGPLAIEALVDAHLPPTLAKLRPDDAAAAADDEEDEDAPLYARLGLSASLCDDDAPLARAHKLAAAGAAALDAELQNEAPNAALLRAVLPRLALAAHFVATASGAPASAAASTEAAMASAHRAAAHLAERRRELLDGSAVLDELRALAFFAAALLDAQPAAAAADDDWSGDEEGPASAFAMLDLSAGLFEEA
jgi:hypothetical protein